MAQLIFVSCLLVTAFLLVKRIRFVWRNIASGKSQPIKDHRWKRFQRMALMAFGQKKMFDRPLVAFLHLFIYLGFIIVNVEMLEIVLDGILGTHRIFRPLLGDSYDFFINVFEFFAVTVIVGCIVFLCRRNIAKVKRLSARHEEMKSWPRLDANLILITEVVLMLAFLTMNAAGEILDNIILYDCVLIPVDSMQRMTPQEVESMYVGYKVPIGELGFMVSRYLIPVFKGIDETTLHIIERLTWWIHILGVMAFAIYVTYSKHLHIFLAFPNTYFSRLQSDGKMTNMPAVTKEVKSMLGIAEANEAPSAEIARFGAKDSTDLSWKNLMDAYTCTECGRCTSVCPANLTGKKLSPRKIMMDTRDRMEELGRIRDKGIEVEKAKTLLDDYITREEVMACTTCNACVDACPVLINPLDIILELRRFISMEESKAPASWNAMYANIETSFTPWKFSPSDRFNWKDKLIN